MPGVRFAERSPENKKERERSLAAASLPALQGAVFELPANQGGQEKNERGEREVSRSDGGQEQGVLRGRVKTNVARHKEIPEVSQGPVRPKKGQESLPYPPSSQA